jgi:hypothetical protein
VKVFSNLALLFLGRHLLVTKDVCSFDISRQTNWQGSDAILLWSSNDDLHEKQAVTE